MKSHKRTSICQRKPVCQPHAHLTAQGLLIVLSWAGCLLQETNGSQLAFHREMLFLCNCWFHWGYCIRLAGAVGWERSSLCTPGFLTHCHFSLWVALCCLCPLPFLFPCPSVNVRSWGVSSLCAAYPLRSGKWEGARSFVILHVTQDSSRDHHLFRGWAMAEGSALAAWSIGSFLPH